MNKNDVIISTSPSELKYLDKFTIVENEEEKLLLHTGFSSGYTHIVEAIALEPLYKNTDKNTLKQILKVKVSLKNKKRENRIYLGKKITLTRRQISSNISAWSIAYK